MNQHTPGPWAVTNHAHGTVINMESSRKTRSGASRYAVIGGFDASDSEQFQEAQANARLISAAPELLEALQGMLSLDDEHQRGADDQDVCFEVQQARAAIAKATGGQK